MRQLKDVIKASTPPSNPVQGRGYVGECLVRVECVDGSTVDKLRVSGWVVGRRGYVGSAL